MGGTNPYIKAPEIQRPKKKFKVTFLNPSTTVEVDPKDIPFGATGLPGSILDIALNHGVDIDHACGGVCACATCHVYVKEGLETCSEPTENEMDMLDMAPDLKPNSRLSCQCVPNGESDVAVEIPAWNRNLVKEGKGTE
jgi:2Fe-2S ferredoxin